MTHSLAGVQKINTLPYSFKVEFIYLNNYVNEWQEKI